MIRVLGSLNANICDSKTTNTQQAPCNSKTATEQKTNEVSSQRLSNENSGKTYFPQCQRAPGESEQTALANCVKFWLDVERGL